MDVLELAQREEVDISEIARDDFQGSRPVEQDPSHRQFELLRANPEHQPGQPGAGDSRTAIGQNAGAGFFAGEQSAAEQSTGFKHMDYWKRSIYAATAAKTLAAKAHMVQVEECFLAALLQDLGMLVLDQVLKEEYGPIHEKAANIASWRRSSTSRSG